MSQWVPNPKSLRPQGEEPSNSLLSVESSPLGFSAVAESESSRWVDIAPFFLSALFFLTAFFAIFSPLPLLLLQVRRGRKWAYAAVATNALWVGFAAGELSLIFFFIFSVSLALTLGEMSARKNSLEKMVVVTLIVMAFSGLLFGLSYAQIHHLNPIQSLKEQVSSFVDYFTETAMQSSLLHSADVDAQGLKEEWKRSLVVEFPSGLAIFSLFAVWSNLMLLLRMNPRGIREKLGLDASFLKRWKAPDSLIWPTLFSGFFLVFNLGVVSDIALNVFKFLMAIYAFQGLSILSHFFDLWNIRGFFRFLGFTVSVFLMMPLVLSLGFFDLWFDFRAKFRQSSV